MLTDRKLIWVVEYVIGLVLLASTMPFIVHPRPGWSDAHGWAYLLFIACAGIALLSSASEMRQRMQLAQRIAKLEQMAANPNQTQNQASSEGDKKRTLSKHLIGSVN